MSKNFKKLKQKALDKTKEILEYNNKKILEDYLRVQSLLKEYNKDPNYSDKFRVKKIKVEKNIKNKKLSKPERRKRRNILFNSCGEVRIIEYLRDNKINFNREYEFKDLVNPNTNQRLRFDFFIPSKNICIEFDGRQHFEYTPEFHGEDKEGLINFKKQIYRDNLKTNYCKDKNIKLVRIKYSDYNNIQEILNKALNEN